MIVLHAAWLPRANALALWAEDSTQPRAGSGRNRPSRRRRPEPHPFALDAEGIRLALAELGGFAAQDAIAKADDTELALELPAAGGGPAGSPWLEDDVIEDDVIESGAIESSPDESIPTWTVPGIVLEPAQATDLVLALTITDPAGPSSEQSGVVAAYDLEFAARSAEMALELDHPRPCSPNSRAHRRWLAGAMASPDRRA